VIARFLDVLAQPDRTFSRNQLQVATGVNYDVFRRYVEFLESKGYIATREGAIIVLTADGRRVREELIASIARFLDDSQFIAARVVPPASRETRGGDASPAPR
jgi:predicted transcriptional regulator